jgi:hypothetical protein
VLAFFFYQMRSEPQASEQGEAKAPEDNRRDARWTVLFRGDDPSRWNTDSPDEKNFAIPVSGAEAAVRFLRLTRMDTGEALIIPIARERLDREPKPFPDEGFAWNGSARLAYGARPLGIAQAPRHRFPAQTGLFVVASEGLDVFTGSGFGGKYQINDRQYHGWKGEAIAPTAFEIAVTCDALTADEETRLLK